MRSWVIALKTNYPTPKSRSLYRQFVAKHPGRAPGTCTTEEIEDDRKRKSVSTIGNGVPPIIEMERFAHAKPGDRSEIGAHPMGHVITGKTPTSVQQKFNAATQMLIFETEPSDAGIKTNSTN